MKVLIIYDSVFGNTEQIALAINNSLISHEDIEASRVSNVKPEQLIGLDLLIVGSPTRAFNPTKAINDFLKKIPSNNIKGVKVAAFDTRIDTNDIKSSMLNILIKLFGYAAKPISDKLKKKGGKVIIAPEGFFVKGEKGPLKDNELERAADWAKLIIKNQ